MSNRVMMSGVLVLGVVLAATTAAGIKRHWNILEFSSHGASNSPSCHGTGSA